MKTNKPNFLMKNYFSLIMLYPQTEEAYNFIKENVYLDNWQNSNNIAVEPRYFDDLAEGITLAGLTIN